VGEERSDTRPLSGLMGLAAGLTRSAPDKSPKGDVTPPVQPEAHAATPPPVGVSSERAGSVDEEDDDVSTLVSAASEPTPSATEVGGDDPDDDPAEDSPTHPRDLPPTRFTLPPEPLVDEPSQRPADPVTLESVVVSETVVIVNGANTDERLECEVVRVTGRHLYVTENGATRRISRAAGFEHPPGGSWSTWRLSGRDRRRWQTEPD
jgi:hypothetical protein